jgi:2-polyprenyl-3-methyl-5-hydroxy-6-metoxy-1,4-benzoquinol methylase
MNKDASNKGAKEAYLEGTDYQFETPEAALGEWTSLSLRTDPKHLCFVLSRYKFCAKMFEGKKTIMEVGPGDGFGLPIIAQSAERVYAIDWDNRLLEGNARRLPHLKNVTYIHLDLNEVSPDIEVDAVAMIDVIEHLECDKEAGFMRNVVKCLKADGVLIIGTPNINAAEYASPQSKVQHINLKSMHALRILTLQYFNNVFMFGMNDEVIHTGYAPMCHYIWALGAGVRNEWILPG